MLQTFLSFVFWIFFLVWDFGFRISYFLHFVAKNAITSP